MTSFRYQAIRETGDPIKGVIEAEDRRSALLALSERGLFPSDLQMVSANGNGNGATAPAKSLPETNGKSSEFRIGTGVRRKEITAFTREIAALLGAGIPIPQALAGLGQEEENLALREIILSISDSVRKGSSISSSLEEHPKLFNKLYVSMVRVGEEAGALPKVMTDLANLLEHEDEVRGEVTAAVSYPVFVLAFGIFTVTILLTVVLPRLFSMLEEMLPILPLPTLVLLRVSGFLHHQWPWVLGGLSAALAGLRWYLRSSQGAAAWDQTKLQLPILGTVL